MTSKKEGNYSFSHEVQLMESVYPGTEVQYREKLFSTHDAEGNVLLFTMSELGKIILLQKAENSTGYVETALNAGLPSNSTIINMEVDRGREKGSSIIAVTVKEQDDVQSIWHTTLKSQQVKAMCYNQEANSTDHQWISKGRFAGKNIEDITVGYSKDEAVQVAFSTLTTLANGERRGEVTIFEPGVNSVQEKTITIKLPESPIEIIKIKIDHNFIYEKMMDNVDGLLYILYKVDDSREGYRMCTVTYPQIAVAEVNIEKNCHCFGITNRQGLPMLFCGIEDKVLLYDKSYDPSVKTEDPIHIGSFDNQVGEIKPLYNHLGDALQVYVRLERGADQTGGDVYYCEEIAASLEGPLTKHVPKEWKNPLLFRSDVKLMHASLLGSSKEIYFYENDSGNAKTGGRENYQFVYCKQGDMKTDSLWHEQKITVENPEVKGAYYYKSYQINIKLNDDSTADKPLDWTQETVDIKCSQNVMIKINDTSIHANGDIMKGSFDSEGRCTIEIPVSTANTPLFNISSPLIKEVLQVDPSVHVKNKFDAITQSAESLKNTQIQNRNGSAGEPLVPQSSYDKILHAMPAVQQLKGVIKKQASNQKPPGSMDDFDNNIDVSGFENFSLKFNADGSLGYQEHSQAEISDFYSQYSAGPNEESNNWFKIDIGDAVNSFIHLVDKIEKGMIDEFIVLVHAEGNYLKMIIKLGKMVWHGIVSTVEQAWKMAGSVLEKALGIAIAKLMEFFSFLFPWEEINRTRQALSFYIQASFNRLLKKLDEIKDNQEIKKVFHDLAEHVFGSQANNFMDTVKEKLGVTGNKSLTQLNSEHDDTKAYSELPSVQWAKKLLKPNSPGSSTENAPDFSNSINDDLIAEIENILNRFVESSIEDVTENIDQVIKDIKSNPDITLFEIIQKVVEALGKTILEETGDIVQMVFDIAVVIMEKAWELITRTYDLGILNRIYKLVTGSEKFSILDALCFVMAIPAVIINKAFNTNIHDIMPHDTVTLIEKYKISGDLESLYSNLAEMGHTNDSSIDEKIVKSILSFASCVMTTLANMFTIPASWVTQQIKGKILAFINFSIGLTSSMISLGLGIWNMVKYKGSQSTIVETGIILSSGVYMGILGFCKIILPSTCKTMLNCATVAGGITNILGSLFLFFAKITDPGLPSTKVKIIDPLLQVVQNIGGGIAKVASGIIPEIENPTPQVLIAEKGVEIIVYTLSAGIYSMLYLARIAVVWFPESRDVTEMNEDSSYAVIDL